MNINFATYERKKVLDYIKTVYPNKEITDCANSAGPLLDMIEQKLVRIYENLEYFPEMRML